MKYKHLHHVDLPNYYQFITFRTHDSLDNFLAKLTSQTKPNSEKQLEIDKYMDKSNTGCYLHGEVLIFLYEYFREQNNSLYQLAAFTIMPNHVHFLFKPLSNLSSIMQKIKGATSLQINKLLKTKGTFWANNYYGGLCETPPKVPVGELRN